jgi:hypothetical protein
VAAFGREGGSSVPPTLAPRADSEALVTEASTFCTHRPGANHFSLSLEGLPFFRSLRFVSQPQKLESRVLRQSPARRRTRRRFIPKNEGINKREQLTGKKEGREKQEGKKCAPDNCIPLRVQCALLSPGDVRRTANLRLTELAISTCSSLFFVPTWYTRPAVTRILVFRHFFAVPNCGREPLVCGFRGHFKGHFKQRVYSRAGAPHAALACAAPASCFARIAPSFRGAPFVLPYTRQLRHSERSEESLFDLCACPPRENMHGWPADY